MQPSVLVQIHKNNFDCTRTSAHQCRAIKNRSGNLSPVDLIYYISLTTLILIDNDVVSILNTGLIYLTLSVPMKVLSPIRDRCVLAFVNSLKICGEWGGLTRVISVPSWAAAWVSRHSTYNSWPCHLATSSSFVKLSNCCWVSFTRLGCLGECGLLGFPPVLLLWGLLGEDGPVDLTSLHSSAISPLIRGRMPNRRRSLYRAQNLPFTKIMASTIYYRSQVMRRDWCQRTPISLIHLKQKEIVVTWHVA